MCRAAIPLSFLWEAPCRHQKVMFGKTLHEFAVNPGSSLFIVLFVFNLELSPSFPSAFLSDGYEKKKEKKQQQQRTSGGK